MYKLFQILGRLIKQSELYVFFPGLPDQTRRVLMILCNEFGTFDVFEFAYDPNSVGAPIDQCRLRPFSVGRSQLSQGCE